MKRKADGLLDLRGSLDPAVEAAIGQGSKRLSESALPRRERQRLAKDRARQEKRRGRQALYDLPVEIKDAISALAAEHGTTASQVAALGLYLFIGQVERKEIELREWREPIQHPRYEYRIRLPEKTG